MRLQLSRWQTKHECKLTTPNFENQKKIFDKANKQGVVSNYLSRTQEDRPLKSTTMLFRKKNGKPVLALCINFELTEILKTRQLLENISAVDPAENEFEAKPPKPRTDNEDIAAISESIVSNALQELKRPFKFAEKTERLEVLKTMQDKGLFLIKGGIDLAARRLEVSRFAIYNYLKDLRYLR